MTDTTTLAPTDAEILVFADEHLRFIDCCNGEVLVKGELAFARAVLAKWGAPAPASGQVVALVKQLVDALEDANADSSEVLGNYTQLYSEAYRPHRLLAQQEIVKQGEEAIAAAKEYLAAPPAQEARVPLTSEQQRCIAEAHNVAACEEYFSVRPQIDCSVNRRIFEAGFSKGYGITAAQKEAT